LFIFFTKVHIILNREHVQSTNFLCLKCFY